jgi:hypothetical protein
MPARVSLRALSPEGRQAVEDLTHSRTVETRAVERARIIATRSSGAGGVTGRSDGRGLPECLASRDLADAQ